METKAEEKKLNDLLWKIGQKVKMLREEKGISQEELSFCANIHRTQVSRIENGENNVSMRSLVRLANYFQVEINEFFDFKDIK